MSDRKIRDAKLHVARGADPYEILWRAHAAQDAQYGVGAVLNNIPLIVQALAPVGAPPTTTTTTDDVRSDP
jgi:hypothetical protein